MDTVRVPYPQMDGRRSEAVDFRSRSACKFPEISDRQIAVFIQLLLKSRCFSLIPTPAFIVGR